MGLGKDLRKPVADRLPFRQDFGRLGIGCLFSSLVAVLGCSDVRLMKMTDQPPIASGKGELCITEPDEVQRWMKFLFVIDKSGSNDTTDPGAAKRAGNIERFLQSNVQQTSYQYGMIWFAGDRAGSYINNGNDQSPTFTADLNVALQAANRLRSADGSTTPYRSALNLARAAIRMDRDAHPGQEIYYMVLFISDGEPTDEGLTESELDNLVTETLNLSPKYVRLSTAFYGNSGREAEARLKRMSERGQGKFVNFEQNVNWDFNELIVRPTFEPWQLKYDLLVYNLNAGFCEDGSVDVDSDIDGMCDKDEVRYPGFDPTKRFSFGDGYGDYFHWRRFRYRESLPPCQDRSDEDHDLLTACEEAYIRNDNPSRDVGKNGDPKHPDTDRDGILDGIETFVYMPRTMAYAMDADNLQENFDGEEPARRQIGEHRNPLIRDPFQLAYDVSLRPLLREEVDCYEFRQSVLPLYDTRAVAKNETLRDLEHGKGENIVLVYYLQSRQSDPKGDGIYRFSYQKLRNDDLTRQRVRSNQALVFDRKVFQSYRYGRFRGSK